MDQDRLFRAAPAVIHVHATYVAGEGWSVTINMRREHETWREARPVVYSHLVTPEMLDSVLAELEVMLGL